MSQPVRDVKFLSKQNRRRCTSNRWLRLSLISTLPLAMLAESPLSHNGGSILAMAGKNCVAVAVDKQFGQGNSLVAVRKRPIFHFPDTTLVAFAGFERDVQSLGVELTAQVARTYSRGLGFSGFARRQRTTGDGGGTGRSAVSVSVKAIASLTSNILYNNKAAPYYVESIVIGLEPEGIMTPDNTTSINRANETKDDSISSGLAMEIVPLRRRRHRPYMCSMDVLGAMSTSQTFVCAGTALKSLYGTAEAMWKPDLPADKLLPLCAQAFLSALERDAFSGYGATIYMLTPEGIEEYDVDGRSD